MEEAQVNRYERQEYQAVEGRFTHDVLFVIKVELTDYEKIIYKRYIEAEKEEPDFIEKNKI